MRVGVGLLVFMCLCTHCVFLREQTVIEGSVTAKTIADTASRAENPIRVLSSLLIKVGPGVLLRVAGGGVGGGGG